MKPVLIALALLSVLSARTAQAGGPRVTTDIPPVHSLVAQVMDGVGTPDLLLPPGASPHHYSMKPSEAVALARSRVIFQVGGGLTPCLGGAIATLAPDAISIRLIDTPGTIRLAYRDTKDFANHAHDDGTGNESAHHGHGTGVMDTHAWLDPVNARVWLDTIAMELARADPDNAPRYRRNAAVAKAGIDTLMAEVTKRLTPVMGRRFVVFHDAFHYFEERFGIEATAAIAVGDAAAPGPARIEMVLAQVASLNVACVFTEPQFDAKLVTAVTEGTGTRIGVLDPLGAGLAPGKGLYAKLIMDLAVNLADCLD